MTDPDVLEAVKSCEAYAQKIIDDFYAGFPKVKKWMDKTDADAVRRKMAYAFKMIRAQSGMNRKDFSAWLGIPYRTMQEWELGRRAMPEYVLRLIAYKVQMEKERGNL